MDKRNLVNHIVLFKVDSSAAKYGEVMETAESRIKIRELLKPEDLKGNFHTGGRHVFCGDRELYRTSKFSEILAKAVQSVHPIASLSDYHSSKGFLLRQTYDLSIQFLHPDLPKVCLCKENLNPDLDFFICPSCNGIYHNACVDNNTCPDCKLPAKRPYPPSAPDSPIKQAKIAIGQECPLPLDLDKYKTLSAEAKRNLTEQIRTVHMNYLAIQSSLSHDDKTRQQILSKIKCALLLAYEETKSIESFTIQFPSIEKLAVSIEAAIYFSTNQNVKSSEYSKKIRSLLFNLTAEKNPDFRGGILKGEIDPKDICQMQSKDMASSEIKNFRQERQKVYTKEQLILTENSKKLVVKTRKGEAVINVNEGFVSDEFGQDILDKMLKRRDSERQEVEDDPFNPENYEGGTEELHDLQLIEIVKEWTGDSVLGKIRDKLVQYLPETQSSRILARINSIRVNKS